MRVRVREIKLESVKVICAIYCDQHNAGTRFNLRDKISPIPRPQFTFDVDTDTNNTNTNNTKDTSEDFEMYCDEENDMDLTLSMLFWCSNIYSI